jgi:hypothetical protein
LVRSLSLIDTVCFWFVNDYRHLCIGFRIRSDVVDGCRRTNRANRGNNRSALALSLKTALRRNPYITPLAREAKNRLTTFVNAVDTEIAVAQTAAQAAHTTEAARIPATLADLVDPVYPTAITAVYTALKAAIETAKPGLQGFNTYAVTKT